MTQQRSEPDVRASFLNAVLGGTFWRTWNMETLAEALPREQQRVRELLPMYDAVPNGNFAAAMMRNSLARAEQAATSGDVVAMLAAYEDLNGYAA